jgi:hypothetical protein
VYKTKEQGQKISLNAEKRGENPKGKAKVWEQYQGQIKLRKSMERVKGQRTKPKLEAKEFGRRSNGTGKGQ